MLNSGIIGKLLILPNERPSQYDELVENEPDFVANFLKH